MESPHSGRGSSYFPKNEMRNSQIVTQVTVPSPKECYSNLIIQKEVKIVKQKKWHDYLWIFSLTYYVWDFLTFYVHGLV